MIAALALLLPLSAPGPSPGPTAGPSPEAGGGCATTVTVADPDGAVRSREVHRFDAAGRLAAVDSWTPMLRREIGISRDAAGCPTRVEVHHDGRRAGGLAQTRRLELACHADGSLAELRGPDGVERWAPPAPTALGWTQVGERVGPDGARAALRIEARPGGDGALELQIAVDGAPAHALRLAPGAAPATPVDLLPALLPAPPAGAPPDAPRTAAILRVDAACPARG